MQQPISDTSHLRKTLNSADDAEKAKAVNCGSDFKDIIDKIIKLEILVKKTEWIPIL